MLKRLFAAVILFMIMLALPLIALSDGGKEPSAEVRPAQEIEENEATPEGADAESRTEVFCIKDGDGSIREIPDREFCIGALAYELAPSYETEALKAQTVALYTHFCRLRNAARESGREYEFEADISGGEYYLDREMLKKRWGTAFDEGIKKTEEAVDSVFGLLLTDGGGELVDAAYFAVSSGRTEDAQYIFGKKTPCLEAVPSPWDELSPYYKSTAEFTDEEIVRKLSAVSGDAAPDADAELTEPERTPSGSVIKMTICGTELSGADIRRALGLRSANFEVRRSGGSYIFTVYGYGHGVGMSQNGANEMAKQGADFREILRHYYKGSIISGTLLL